MRKFIAYYRVSSEEQRKGKMSLPTQAEDVHAYARQHGISLVREFEETHSGRWPGKRPVFESALDYLRSHPEVEGVIAFDVNRLARNLTDGAYLLEVLRKSVICLGQSEITPDDPTATFTFGVLLSVSAHYSSHLSARVKRGMKGRMERGHFPGSRPLGYVVDDSVAPHSTKQDPERASMIRELFEVVSERGLSLSEAREWSKARGLRSKGGRVLSKSEVHFILTNPAYFGMVRTTHGLIRGVHPPIVSKVLFDRTREVLARPGGKGQRNWFPFRGMLRCGHCGRQIQITPAESGGKIYRYCHCYGPKTECSRPSFREDALSDRLACVVKAIRLTPDMEAGIRQLVEEGEARQEELAREAAGEIRRLQGEIEQKAQHRVAAGRKHVEGTIDAASYTTIVGEIDNEIEMIKERIGELRSLKPLAVEGYEDFFKLLERAPELYMRRDIEERAKMLRAVTSNIEVTEEKIVPVYRKPFGAVAKSAVTGKMWA